MVTKRSKDSHPTYCDYGHYTVTMVTTLLLWWLSVARILISHPTYCDYGHYTVAMVTTLLLW